MRISDWSSDVCSSDLSSWIMSKFFVVLIHTNAVDEGRTPHARKRRLWTPCTISGPVIHMKTWASGLARCLIGNCSACSRSIVGRSEEQTSELQSLMRHSYAVFCLKTKNTTPTVSHVRNERAKHR